MKKYTTEDIREFTTRPLFDERVLLNKEPSYPKISIVTPSFNQGQFLERTIVSVLNQSYPNLEYIIVDGGSTDGSVEIIKKYEKYLTYWVSEKDTGQSEALNKGFNRATGELIGWQNSDDIYLPASFYKLAEIFKENPDVDIIFGNRLDVDEQDNVIGESRFTPFTVVGHWYEGMALSNQSTFWRKTLFLKVGMIDPQFHLAMDYEFFLRAGLRGAEFKRVPYFWGAIRRHEDAKTGNPASVAMKKGYEKECDIIDKLYGRKNYLNRPLRIYSFLRRILFYFLQADWDYIFKGLKRRIQMNFGKRKGPV